MYHIARVMIRCVAYPKNADDDEEYDLKEVPITVVGNLEEYKFAGPKRIHGLHDSASEIFARGMKGDAFYPQKG